jgi:hypothetical protein
MTNRFRRRPGDVGVAVTALEQRLSELERLTNAQNRELRIQFERIAQLQAEWDIMRIRSSNTGGGGVDCPVLLPSEHDATCVGEDVRLMPPQGAGCRWRNASVASWARASIARGVGR